MWSEEYEQRAAQMRERNQRERLALSLGREHLRIAETISATRAIERHYTPREIGSLWKLHPSSIIRMFREEPGVLKIGKKSSKRGRRSHLMLRVPESVLQRVHRRLTVGETA
jgi:hypothetical protein